MNDRGLKRFYNLSKAYGGGPFTDEFTDTLKAYCIETDRIPFEFNSGTGTCRYFNVPMHISMLFYYNEDTFNVKHLVIDAMSAFYFDTSYTTNSITHSFEPYESLQIELYISNRRFRKIFKNGSSTLRSIKIFNINDNVYFSHEASAINIFLHTIHPWLRLGKLTLLFTDVYERMHMWTNVPYSQFPKLCSFYSNEPKKTEFMHIHAGKVKKFLKFKTWFYLSLRKGTKVPKDVILMIVNKVSFY